MGLFGKKNKQRKDDNEEHVTNSRTFHSDDAIGIFQSKKSGVQSNIESIDRTIREYESLIKDEEKIIKKNQPGYLDLWNGGFETEALISTRQNSDMREDITEMRIEILKLNEEKSRLITSTLTHSGSPISLTPSPIYAVKIDDSNNEIDNVQSEIDKLRQESENDFKEMKELTKNLSEGMKHLSKKNSTNDDPIKILKLRLAKGEITKEEFNEIKESLED